MEYKYNNLVPLYLDKVGQYQNWKEKVGMREIYEVQGKMEGRVRKESKGSEVQVVMCLLWEITEKGLGSHSAP